MNLDKNAMHLVISISNDWWKCWDAKYNSYYYYNSDTHQVHGLHPESPPPDQQTGERIIPPVLPPPVPTISHSPLLNQTLTPFSSPYVPFYGVPLYSNQPVLHESTVPAVITPPVLSFSPRPQVNRPVPPPPPPRVPKFWDQSETATVLQPSASAAQHLISDIRVATANAEQQLKKIALERAG